MKYQITWRSGSTEIVEGDTWQKALHAKNIPSHRWSLIKRIRRAGPPIEYLTLPRDASGVKTMGAIPEKDAGLLEEIDVMLTNAGAIK